MSLPSQTARTSPAGRSFVYRRRRNRRRPPPAVIAAAVGGAAVLVLGGVLIFGPDRGGGPSRAGASEASLDPAGSRSAVTEPLVGKLPDEGRVDGLTGVGRPPGSSETARRSEVDSRVVDAGGSSTGTGPAGGTSLDEDVPTGLTPPPMVPQRGMLAEALESGGDAAGLPGTRAVGGDRAGVSGVSDRSPGAGADASDRVTSRGSGRITMHLDAADSLVQSNDLLAARQALWDAMAVPGLDELEAKVLRDRLTVLNQKIVFEGPHRAGDRLSETYTVKSGDALSSIAKAHGGGTHWKLIQRVNGLSSPNRITVGQTLKILRGPFHAVVDKSDFRLDLYQGPTERPEEWVFVRSFEVGLGEGDSTPIGHFIVRKNGKLENPGWVNPRDGTEKYAPDDPNNPIGDFWVGIDGLGDSAVHTGYGLHGTIDPGSIGKERSMGCVRLRPDDIALVYELLSEGQSLVRIRR